MRAARCVLAAALAAAALAAQPATARVWLPAERLAPDGGQSGDVAVTSLGETVVSWVQYSGPGAFPLSARVAVKAPGLPLGPPKILDAAAGGTPVSLATDGAGRSLASWARADGELMLSRRPAGGEFSDPVDLGRSVDNATVYMNERGDAVLLSWDNGARTLSFGSATGDFSAPVPVGEGAGNTASAAKLSGDGEFLLVEATAPSASGPGLVHVTGIRPGDSAATSQTLPVTGTVRGLSLGTDRSGAGALVWWEQDGDTPAVRDVISERAPGEAFGAPRQLSLGTSPAAMTMAVAPDGTMTIATSEGAWSARAGGDPEPILMPKGGLGSPPLLATSRSGETLLATLGDFEHAVSATRRGADGFGPVQDVRPGCDRAEYLQVAIGEDGAAAALIRRRDEMALAVDAPSDAPGSQECVSRPALYGREPDPATGPGPVYPPTPDWAPREPTALPDPGLVLKSVRISGAGARRVASVTAVCGGPCRLTAEATLRLKRGGIVLSRGRVAKRTQTGRAQLTMRLKVSKRAERRLAARPRPRVQLRLRVMAVGAQGARHVKVATRAAR